MRAIETGVLCFSRVVSLSLIDIWNCPAVTVWAQTYTHILIVQTQSTTNYTHRSLKIFRRRRHDHRMLTPLRQCTPPAGGSDSCVFYAKIGSETRIANVSKKNTLGVKEMLKCSNISVLFQSTGGRIAWIAYLRIYAINVNQGLYFTFA